MIDGLYCFQLVDTYGLPVDFMVDLLWSENMVPEWKSFCHAALDSGWNWRTLMARLA